MPTAKSEHNSPKGLYRSETNKVIAGVCGGLGEFFNVDPLIIRIIFILATVFGGSGLLVYLILWVLMPNPSQASTSPKDHIKENVEEIRQTAKNFASDIRTRRDQNSKQWLGIILLILGLIFLLQNFGFNDYINFGRLWPIFLVLVGLLLLFRR